MAKTSGKHTPGPWNVKLCPACGEGCDTYTIEGPTRTHPERTGSLEKLMVFGKDAHLIVAAPEMLEALEDIVEQFEKTHFQVGPDLSDSIRVFGKQAITKARGE